MYAIYVYTYHISIILPYIIFYLYIYIIHALISMYRYHISPVYGRSPPATGSPMNSKVVLSAPPSASAIQWAVQSPGDGNSEMLEINSPHTNSKLTVWVMIPTNQESFTSRTKDRNVNRQRVINHKKWTRKSWWLDHPGIASKSSYFILLIFGCQRSGCPSGDPTEKRFPKSRYSDKDKNTILKDTYQQPRIQWFQCWASIVAHLPMLSGLCSLGICCQSSHL